jgi:hypothetical protein
LGQVLSRDTEAFGVSLPEGEDRRRRAGDGRRHAMDSASGLRLPSFDEIWVFEIMPTAPETAAPAVLSPERAALAAALARLANLEAFVDRARAGMAAIQAKVDAAGGALQAAEVALRAAERDSEDTKGALQQWATSKLVPAVQNFNAHSKQGAVEGGAAVEGA